jgi:hypothetical protein
VGVLAAGIYAVRALVVPTVADWYTGWAERRRKAREAAIVQAAALADAAGALKVTLVMSHVAMLACVACWAQFARHRCWDPCVQLTHSMMSGLPNISQVAGATSRPSLCIGVLHGL